MVENFSENNCNFQYPTLKTMEENKISHKYNSFSLLITSIISKNA